MICEQCQKDKPEVEYCEDVDKTLCVNCYANLTYVLDIGKKRPAQWADWEIEYLLKHGGAGNFNTVAKALNRPPSKVREKWYGLKRKEAMKQKKTPAH